MRRTRRSTSCSGVAVGRATPGARGSVQIEVTFVLDANGTLSVHAVDQRTGQRQSIRIVLVGGVDEDRISAMQQRVDAKYQGG